MRSVKYLEQLQSKLKNSSQEQIADLLGISRGAVSHYLTGRRVMDDETCLAVAIQLDIDPLHVVGAACIDRAEKSGQSSLWEVFMARTAATAATVMMAASVNLFLTPTEAQANPAKAPFLAQQGDSLYYVKSDAELASSEIPAAALKASMDA